MTTISASLSTTPRAPALGRDVAMRLAVDEYDRVLAQLRSLAPADWSLSTACAGWDVRALATHMLGMVELAASLHEQVRQMATALRAGGVFVDALTALQVEERRHLTGRDIVEGWGALAPLGDRARRRSPALLRRMPLPVAQPIGARPDSPTERWRWGYLNDVINTRDPWMHRTDIAAAAGLPLVLTADHDGVLVADVVHEWAERHGQPCRLTLTGPAGGLWSWGSGDPELELDAVRFCRGLSGRDPGDGLLAVEVPF